MEVSEVELEASDSNGEYSFKVDFQGTWLSGFFLFPSWKGVVGQIGTANSALESKV